MAAGGHCIKWLSYPPSLLQAYVLGLGSVGRNQHGCITFAFSGSQHSGYFNDAVCAVRGRHPQALLSLAWGPGYSLEL